MFRDLHAVLDVRLPGAFYVTRPAIRVMRENGYGRIVPTSSASGVPGNFGRADYGAAEMGLVGLIDGYFRHPGREGVPTIEDVAEHLDTIRNEDGYLVGSSGRDEFTRLAPRMLG